MTPAVRFAGIERWFGRNQALAGVDMVIERGTCLGLIGRNGAGKTTLLRLIPGLLHPTRGEVAIFGRDPWEHEELVKQRIGCVFQSDELPQGVRLESLLALCRDAYSRWNREFEQRLIECFGLNPRALIGQFSTGQQRAVSLIMAVGHHPELLVLDEPAGSLDAVARRAFLEVILSLVNEFETTVILSSHQFADMERLANRVAILHQGRVLADGPRENYEQESCRVDIEHPAAKYENIVCIEGCVRVRRQGTAWTCTFTTKPETAAMRIHAVLGEGGAVKASPVGLEELFVDWTSDF